MDNGTVMKKVKVSKELSVIFSNDLPYGVLFEVNDFVVVGTKKEIKKISA